MEEIKERERKLMITIWRNAAAGKELTDCYWVQWCLLLLVELFINNRFNVDHVIVGI